MISNWYERDEGKQEVDVGVRKSRSSAGNLETLEALDRKKSSGEAKTKKVIGKYTTVVLDSKGMR